MQHVPDVQAAGQGAVVQHFRDHVLEALLGKAADADQPLRLQRLDDGCQVTVAGGFQCALLGHRQLHRGAVLARGFQEHQRAVVDDDGLRKEIVGTAEAATNPSPKSATTHFRPSARKTVNRTLGMLMRRCLDGGLDAHPVTHRRDLAEGHAGLHHAEGARVHAQEHDLLVPLAIAGQIGGVRLPGILQRVVDVRHRRGKTQRFQLVAQLGGRLDQALAGGVGGVGSAGGNVRSFSVGHGSGQGSGMRGSGNHRTPTARSAAR